MTTQTFYSTEGGSLSSQRYSRWVPVGAPQVTAQSTVRRTIKRSTVNTPNFRHRDPAKLLLPNSFEYTKTDEVLEFLTNRSYNYDMGDGMAFTGSRGSSVELPPMPNASEIDRLKNQAINRLLSRIKDSKVNIAQVFAERKQTADLIASTAIRIAGCFSSLRKGNLPMAADYLGLKIGKRANRRFNYQFRRDQSKAVANQWLELQYGWKPLLQDIYGSAELLAQHTFREVRGRAIGSASSNAKTQSKTTEIGSFPTGTCGRDTVLTEINYQYSVKYTCWFSVDSELRRTVAQVGLSNPALLAWELLPYSFVVDWFIPIGNYLESLDATSGMKFVTGCLTTFYRGQIVRTRTGTQQYVAFYRAIGTQKGSTSYIHCKRTVLSSFPRASLPSFKNPFSFVHAANAIALLRTTFKR